MLRLLNLSCTFLSLLIIGMALLHIGFSEVPEEGGNHFLARESSCAKVWKHFREYESQHWLRKTVNKIFAKLSFSIPLAYNPPSTEICSRPLSFSGGMWVFLKSSFHGTVMNHVTNGEDFSFIWKVQILVVCLVIMHITGFSQIVYNTVFARGNKNVTINTLLNETNASSIQYEEHKDVVPRMKTQNSKDNTNAIKPEGNEIAPAMETENSKYNTGIIKPEGTEVVLTMTTENSEEFASTIKPKDIEVVRTIKTENSKENGRAIKPEGTQVIPTMKTDYSKENVGAIKTEVTQAVLTMKTDYSKENVGAIKPEGTQVTPTMKTENSKEREKLKEQIGLYELKNCEDLKPQSIEQATFLIKQEEPQSDIRDKQCQNLKPQILDAASAIQHEISSGENSEKLGSILYEIREDRISLSERIQRKKWELASAAKMLANHICSQLEEEEDWTPPMSLEEKAAFQALKQLHPEPSVEVPDTKFEKMTPKEKKDVRAANLKLLKEKDPIVILELDYGRISKEDVDNAYRKRIKSWIDYCGGFEHCQELLGHFQSARRKLKSEISSSENKIYIKNKQKKVKAEIGSSKNEISKKSKEKKLKADSSSSTDKRCDKKKKKKKGNKNKNKFWSL